MVDNKLFEGQIINSATVIVFFRFTSLLPKQINASSIISSYSSYDGW